MFHQEQPMSGTDPVDCQSRLCLICGLRPPVAGGPYTAESSPWCEKCREDHQGSVSQDDTSILTRRLAYEILFEQHVKALHLLDDVLEQFIDVGGVETVERIREFRGRGRG